MAGCMGLYGGGSSVELPVEHGILVICADFDRVRALIAVLFVLLLAKHLQVLNGRGPKVVGFHFHKHLGGDGGGG